MSEHLTTQQIENLVARQLLPGELVQVTRHLAGCKECGQRVATHASPLQRTAQLHAALRTQQPEPEAHLEFEQLADYVENNIAELEREIIRNHLESCSPCALAAQELQALRSDLQSVPAPRQVQPSLWQRLTGRWSVPQLLRPLPLATVGIALLIALLWWGKTKPVGENQVATFAPTPVPLQPSPTPAEPVSSQTPAIIATLQDKGRTVTVDQENQLAGFTDLPKDLEQALQQALLSQQIETPSELKTLLRRPATLMSGAEAQRSGKLLSPVGTFVRDVQPTFHWQPLPGAQSYVVTVLDENFNVVATSPAVARPQWRSTQPLQQGQQYVWQVTAEVAGKSVSFSSAEAPEAHFKILSAAQARTLQTRSQRYQNSHLLLGILYAKAGLMDEAEREYQALRKANPQSVVARKLWQTLRAIRQPDSKR